MEIVRPLRVWFPGARYHVMCRGNRKQPIFWDDADRLAYIQIVGDASVEFGCGVVAFCLMENHMHLFVATGDVSLTKFMHKINMRYSLYVNRRYVLTGRLFQDRYKAVLVKDLGYERTLFRYIHLNPVRAGLVSEAVYVQRGEYLLRRELIWEFRMLVDREKGLALFGGDLAVMELFTELGEDAS
jgi:putative transposase